MIPLADVAGRIIGTGVSGIAKTPLELIVLGVLLVLLIEQEAFRAAGSPRAQARARALEVATVPLFVTFLLIIVVRLADLVH